MSRDDQKGSHDALKKALKMIIAGGLAFWAANFATSLTPIAAGYRTALSISYLPMILVESLLGGMIISCCVSCFLLRYYEKIPARNPIHKSMILSIAALSIASILMFIAASRTSDPSSVLLTGAVINLPRFIALGLAIGYLSRRGVHG